MVEIRSVLTNYDKGYYIGADTNGESFTTRCIITNRHSEEYVYFCDKKIFYLRFRYYAEYASWYLCIHLVIPGVGK